MANSLGSLAFDFWAQGFGTSRAPLSFIDNSRQLPGRGRFSEEGALGSQIDSPGKSDGLLEG